MNYYIITNSLYNQDQKRFNIGGVETYVQGLYHLIFSKGYNVKIIQMCQCDKEIEILYNDFQILLVPFVKSLLKNCYQSTFDYIYEKFKGEDSYFIIDTDQKDIYSTDNHVIQIQHGIAFDTPGYWLSGLWGKNKALQHVNKFLRCFKNIRRLYHTPNTVCVDYNYYNWFRTLGTIYPGYRIKIIPNYSSSFISEAELRDKLNRLNSKIRIIFARRFCDYRGTLIMISAAKNILKKYDFVEFVFAGEGPLKKTILDSFDNEPRVSVMSFHPENSVMFHKGFDIAVVPTIYSEGTSLSLCEAMAAGCVPIATHVGGMTNMILNNYNGFLIDPSERALEKKIEEVILMPKDELNIIAQNAYNSSLCSFSEKRWAMEWAEFLGIN